MEVPPDSTVLDAARLLGIEIPTLCHLPGNCTPLTSCMVCLVRVKGQTRFVPSCATRATDGLEIECDVESVHLARKTAMELLLSDHAGDCLAPCQLVCPAHMHIDEMLHQIAQRNWRRALEVIKDEIPFPSTLGRICPELCEKGCRRSSAGDGGGTGGGAVSICALKKLAGDKDLASPEPYLPQRQPSTGKSVAIVGAGPAGLTAAYFLLRAGHDVTVYDSRPQPGGNLRYAISPEILPPKILDNEIAVIQRLGVHLITRTHLVAEKRDDSSITLEQLSKTYDATILAIGVIDPTQAKALGLAMAGKGLAVDKHSGMTKTPGLFACGAALTPHRLAVRAVGDGHHVAKAVDAFLRGVHLSSHSDLFSVRLNVLSPIETKVMLAGAVPEPRAEGKNLTEDQAVTEAQRCMNCGCSGVTDCALRKVSMEYDANPNHFRGERRKVEPAQPAGDVVFEPAKCISCGKCVTITAGGTTSQAYHGRGFDMRISPTFNATFAEAVSKVAAQVVEACPTAAIRWRT